VDSLNRTTVIIVLALGLLIISLPTIYVLRWLGRINSAFEGNEQNKKKENTERVFSVKKTYPSSSFKV
jgi:hypothetical protein